MKETGLQKETIMDWSSFCREVCIKTCIEDGERIGGPGRTVEIDESKFGKRKYHRGHRVEGQWVFGGIQRDDGRCFMVPVEDRSANTLLPIILDKILPGTTITTDCWKAYFDVGSSGYNHVTVNHSVTFKDPETGAHTNTVEGM